MEGSCPTAVEVAVRTESNVEEGKSRDVLIPDRIGFVEDEDKGGGISVTPVVVSGGRVEVRDGATAEVGFA